MNNQNKILILGLGSEILTDDGIGIKIVNDLKNRIDFTDVDFATVLLGGWELLEMIKDYDVLIAIDGIRSQMGCPGEVYMYSMQNFKETLHLSNVHETGFADTLILGRKIGMKMPEIIRIIAIEIEEDLVFSSNLSANLCSRYEDIVLKIHNWLDLFVNSRKGKLVLT